MRLDKSVSLSQATIYAVGAIVGAGIYTLIGFAAGITGNLLWASFIIAAAIAGLTAYSYSKLTHLFAREAAESVFAINAFGNKKIGFFAGFLTFLTAVFSAATVAWGFAAYFKFFFGFEAVIVAVSVVILLSLVNLFGIKKSVSLNAIFTFLTIIGLVAIIVFGLRFIGSVDLLQGLGGQTLIENSFSLIPSLFSTAALIFFAYLGFEQVANISEEIKDAKNNAPKAIIYSLLFTTIIYVLISIVAVSAIPPAELAQASNPSLPLTEGPLALVAEKVIAPSAGFWISIVALFAIADTVLILLNVASRILYGMSRNGLVPKKFGIINPKTRVPSLAIWIVLIAAVILTLIGNIKLLGNLTTAGTFFLFFIVNISFVIIKYKNDSLNWFHKKSFLASVPIPSFLGALFCLGMFLTQFWETVPIFGMGVPIIVIMLILFLAAYPLYKILNSTKMLNFEN